MKWEGLLTALCHHDACCRLRHMHCPTHVTWSEPMHHSMSGHHENKFPSSEDFAERFGIGTRFAPTGAFCSNIEKGSQTDTVTPMFPGALLFYRNLRRSNALTGKNFSSAKDIERGDAHHESLMSRGNILHETKDSLPHEVSLRLRTYVVLSSEPPDDSSCPFEVARPATHPSPTELRLPRDHFE